MVVALHLQMLRTLRCECTQHLVIVEEGGRLIIDQICQSAGGRNLQFGTGSFRAYHCVTHVRKGARFQGFMIPVYG